MTSPPSKERRSSPPLRRERVCEPVLAIGATASRNTYALRPLELREKLPDLGLGPGHGAVVTAAVHDAGRVTTVEGTPFDEISGPAALPSASPRLSSIEMSRKW
jgi:hypothetical protein